MTHLTTEELLPCAHCGGECHLTHGFTTQENWPDGDFSRVFCTRCQVRQLFHKDDADAIAAWNHRASLPTAAAPAGLTINTEEFRYHLYQYANTLTFGSQSEQGNAFASLIAHIDAQLAAKGSSPATQQAEPVARSWSATIRRAANLLRVHGYADLSTDLEAVSASPQAAVEQQDQASDSLYLDVMNIPCDESKANEEYSDRRIAYKHGHRDARHAAADLIAEFASGGREGRQARQESSESISASAPKASGATHFRKKPVVIEAFQWTGDNLAQLIKFTDGRAPDSRSNFAGMMWERYCDLVAAEGFKIKTLEGTMNADVGDWIIRGVKGELYPCKPDIFSVTYELAATEATTSLRDIEFDGPNDPLLIGTPHVCGLPGECFGTCPSCIKSAATEASGAADWKFVPAEPTEAMVHAAEDLPAPRMFAKVYRAMLAAAPSGEASGAAVPDTDAKDAEPPSKKQEKLRALADRIDNEKLWKGPMMYRDRLTDDQRDRLDAGVMLRRYSDLLAPGRWLVIPPEGCVQFSAGSLDKVMEMAKRDQERIAAIDAAPAAPEQTVKP